MDDDDRSFLCTRDESARDDDLATPRPLFSSPRCSMWLLSSLIDKSLDAELEVRLLFFQSVSN
jgi:hypothetical protein